VRHRPCRTRAPSARQAGAGQHERHGRILRVEQDRQGVVDDWTSLRVGLLDGITHQRDAEALDVRRVPRRVGHLAAGRLVPVEILHLRAANFTALEEPATPEHRVFLANATSMRTNSRNAVLSAAGVQSSQFVSCLGSRGCCCRRGSTRSRRRPRSSARLREEERRHEVATLACSRGVHGGSSVGPSRPKLKLRLLFSPSRLSSPLASLCFRS